MTRNVSAEEAGQRLDRYLAAQLPDLSRTRVQELIAAGHVRVNGRPAKAAHHVATGERVEVHIAPRPAPSVQAEDIPLEILYQDSDIVVVNKPAGMTVHAGAGAAAQRGTLVNALLFHFRQLSSGGGPLRPGIVHRLDKSTSGAMVVARNDAAHRHLAEQFRVRHVRKTYLALLHGRVKQDAGRIELRVARDLHRRTRMTTRRRQGREARTDWRVLLRLDGFTLVEAALHTGRTHQIRVHFSALGHPVAGDTLYGAPRIPRAGGHRLPELGRNFLHAARISFEHPGGAGTVDVRAPLPAALRDYLYHVAEACGMKKGLVDDVVLAYL